MNPHSSFIGKINVWESFLPAFSGSNFSLLNRPSNFWWLVVPSSSLLYFNLDIDLLWFYFHENYSYHIFVCIAGLTYYLGREKFISWPQKWLKIHSQTSARPFPSGSPCQHLQFCFMFVFTLSLTDSYSYSLTFSLPRIKAFP